jgi:hypothetical protein
VPNGGSVEAADAGIFVIKDAAGRAVAQFPEVCPCYRDAGSNTGSDAGK